MESNWILNFKSRNLDIFNNLLCVKTFKNIISICILIIIKNPYIALFYELMLSSVIELVECKYLRDGLKINKNHE